MKQKTSIKVRAAFLLLVFALNTVVGFACSMGVDMSFNTNHHESNEASVAVVHIHKDGKKHIHHEKKEGHSHNNSHNHQTRGNHHQAENKKGNCCTDDVKEFQDLAKSVPNTPNIIHPIFFTAFLASYYYITLLPYTDVVKDIKPFVRSYHPPIPDIRIAIQSFQI